MEDTKESKTIEDLIAILPDTVLEHLASILSKAERCMLRATSSALRKAANECVTTIRILLGDDQGSLRGLDQLHNRFKRVDSLMLSGSAGRGQLADLAEALSPQLLSGLNRIELRDFEDSNEHAVRMLVTCILKVAREVESLTTVIYSRDLTPMQHLKHLRNVDLTCQGGTFRSLAAVESLTSLESLTIKGLLHPSLLSTLPKNLRKLTSIDLTDFDRYSLDLEPLLQQKQLKQLRLAVGLRGESVQHLIKISDMPAMEDIKLVMFKHARAAEHDLDLATMLPRLEEIEYLRELEVPRRLIHANDLPEQYTWNLPDSLTSLRVHEPPAVYEAQILPRGQAPKLKEFVCTLPLPPDVMTELAARACLESVELLAAGDWVHAGQPPLLPSVRSLAISCSDEVPRLIEALCVPCGPEIPEIEQLTLFKDRRGYTEGPFNVNRVLLKLCVMGVPLSLELRDCTGLDDYGLGALAHLGCLRHLVLERCGTWETYGSGHNPVGLTPLGVEALLVHPTLERVQLLGCCGLRYDNEMAALEHHAAGMAGMELTVEYADEPPSPIPSPSPSPSRSLSPPY